jgi:hypothetical protein
LIEADALPGAVSAKGLAAVRRYLERFSAHWSSFRWELLDLEVDGERALMRARLELLVPLRTGVAVGASALSR